MCGVMDVSPRLFWEACFLGLAMILGFSLLFTTPIALIIYLKTSFLLTLFERVII